MSVHTCGWAEVDGVWTCIQDHDAASHAPATGCGRTWAPSTGLTTAPTGTGQREGTPVRCDTCGRAPVGVFWDGSPRFDHSHRPDGKTLEHPKGRGEHLVNERLTGSEWQDYLRSLGGSSGLLGLGRKTAAEMRGKRANGRHGHELGYVRSCLTCSHPHAVGTTCARCPDCTLAAAARAVFGDLVVAERTVHVLPPTAPNGDRGSDTQEQGAAPRPPHIAQGDRTVTETPYPPLDAPGDRTSTTIGSDDAGGSAPHGAGPSPKPLMRMQLLIAGPRQEIERFRADPGVGRPPTMEVGRLLVADPWLATCVLDLGCHLSLAWTTPAREADGWLRRTAQADPALTFALTASGVDQGEPQWAHLELATDGDQVGWAYLEGIALALFGPPDEWLADQCPERHSKVADDADE